MSVAVFQRIVSGAQVEQALITTLQMWMPTYLAEVARQHGKGARELPTVASYTTVVEFDKWPEDQLPACIVVSPGIAEQPSQEAKGKHRAKWAAELALICSASTQKNSLDLAKMYLAAARAAILQHASLGGFASGLEWIDELYDRVPSEDTRNLGAASGLFVVHVDDVTTKGAGPGAAVPEPRIDPTLDYDPVFVEETEVTIEQQDD